MFYGLPRNKGDANNSQRTPILSRSHAKTSAKHGGPGPSCQKEEAQLCFCGTPKFLHNFSLWYINKLIYIYIDMSNWPIYPHVSCGGSFAGLFHKESPLYELGYEGIFKWNLKMYVLCLWNAPGFCTVSSILAGPYEKPKRSPGIFFTVDLPSQISCSLNEW